jgi:hypothetical protein
MHADLLAQVDKQRDELGIDTPPLDASKVQQECRGCRTFFPYDAAADYCPRCAAENAGDVVVEILCTVEENVLNGMTFWAAINDARFARYDKPAEGQLATTILSRAVDRFTGTKTPAEIADYAIGIAARLRSLRTAGAVA